MDADLIARLERIEGATRSANWSPGTAWRSICATSTPWSVLFPADVRVSRDQSGRQALRTWFDQTLREQFSGTAHVTGNHIIEFDDDDHAHGVVYSRNEHETGPEWVIMTMMYFDRYERIDGRLVLPAPPAAVLVRHRPQQAADRRPQDPLARPRALRRRLPPVLADVGRVLGREPPTPIGKWPNRRP